MRRRILILFMAFFIALGAFMPVTRAETPAEAEGKTVAIAEGKAVCLIEARSGMVITGRDEKTKFDAAGLARLPALLVVCEAVDEGKIGLEDSVSVSENAAGVKGPTAFLSAGENISLGELIKSAVMITAGDALYAATEALDASDKVFMDTVDQRLTELNVQVSYSDRLGTGVQYSAEELAQIGAALCQSRTFLAYSGLYYEKLTHESGLVTEMASANKLLKSCTGTNGVATGSSEQAGYCGVFSAERENGVYVCTVLGAKNAQERAKSAKSMLEYAFSAYSSKLLAKKGEILQDNITLVGGVKTSCDLIAARDVMAVMPKQSEYTERREIPEKLSAPLRAGELLGSIIYLDANGETLARVELTVAEDIATAGWQDYFVRFLTRYLHI